MAFIGVDLRTNHFTVCRRQADGRKQLATCQLAAADLTRFCFGLDDAVAVEASGNSAWFCGEIRPCIGRINVVNPKQFQVIRKSVKKTDPNDARALAFFLSKDMLPETRLKSVAESDLASKVHTRDGFVKQLMRTTLVQCTLIALRYSGYLNRFYRRVKERRGASRAIIATARKLLTILYDTLRNGWVFQDFPAFKIAEKQREFNYLRRRMRCESKF